MEPNNEFNEQCIPRIQKALTTVDYALQISTGHDEYQRRKIAYYAVATHFMKEFDPFPGLAIYGPPASGKTMTLNILKATCYKVVPITGETISDAALKATMKEADHGTLIIEEADSVTGRELETTLITRYTKASADLKKMVREGEDWHLAEFATFGATVVHRRNLFRDPAMLRRVITVKAKRKKGEYAQVDKESHASMFQVYRQQLAWRPKLPPVTNRWDVEPAVFDCYKPLLAIAAFIGDTEFTDSLAREMGDASSRLREEETYLEPQMLLRAIITLVSDKVKDKPNLSRVNIENSRIIHALKAEFGALCSVISLSPNQRNRIVREDLGFEIKSSHGRQRVYLTIPQLIKACDDNGVKDDLMDQWRAILDLGEYSQPDAGVDEEASSAWDLET